MKILESLYIKTDSISGRGVFSTKDIPRGTIIEVSPVIVLNSKEVPKVCETLLHDYVFQWGKNNTQCCVALGYVSVYNHSYTANCRYEMNQRKKTMTVRTTKKIKAGEELFVNYNGDANAKTPVWFDKDSKILKHESI